MSIHDPNEYGADRVRRIYDTYENSDKILAALDEVGGRRLDDNERDYYMSQCTLGLDVMMAMYGHRVFDARDVADLLELVREMVTEYARAVKVDIETAAMASRLRMSGGESEGESDGASE